MALSWLQNLILALLLASLPFVWVATHTGARRDRASEGRADGLLLLGSLLCAVFSLVMGATSLSRHSNEAAITRTWTRVDATLGDCSVSENRSGTPQNRSITYSMQCELAYDANGAPMQHSLEAGFPETRVPIDRWMAQHPEGSTTPIYVNPNDPYDIWGLAYGTPVSTVNAAEAARSALGLAAVAAVLFGLSRYAVSQRLARSREGRSTVAAAGGGPPP